MRAATSSPPRTATGSAGGPQVRLHYSARLDASEWEERYDAGEVPDRWPYGLHRLATPTGAALAPVPRRLDHARRVGRRLAGGYDWDRFTVRGDAAVCWDERAGVPVALSGVPTLTGVIWLTERRRRHWTDPLARRALSRSTVFVNSPRQVPHLTTEWSVPAHRVHFVPFGVDVDFWRPVPGRRRGVLIVGNDRHRDHRTSVLAAQQAGQRPTVVTRHRNLPVPTVQLSHVALRRAYADHAVVALATVPNRHASGLTVLLEAMACGRPVVATGGSGLEAYLTPETGILVPPGDVDQMSHAVRHLLADPDRRAAMGRAARAAAESAYSTVSLADSLTTLVRDL